MDQINYFLEKTGVSKISESKRQILDKPITEEKKNSALKESAAVKSPGPDGFTMYYLKKIQRDS